jgi:hypothetical protein
MIGSPENNFITMQSPKPKGQMLGNALQNTQPTQSFQPAMMGANQYGSPTPQMGSMQMPESNAGYNLQPMIPNGQQMPQGPIGMNQTGQNRFGVGLARPMPQQTQVS